MKQYLPISIVSTGLKTCLVTFKTPKGELGSMFSASLLEPGEAVVSDCDDYVYAEYANTDENLQQFNKAAGKFLLLNSIPEVKDRLAIAKIELVNFEDKTFEFIVQLEKNEKRPSKCSLDQKNEIRYSNEDPISQLVLIYPANKLLTEILVAFKVCSEN
jgi:hypothetical protein